MKLLLPVLFSLSVVVPSLVTADGYGHGIHHVPIPDAQIEPLAHALITAIAGRFYFNLKLALYRYVINALK